MAVIAQTSKHYILPLINNICNVFISSSKMKDLVPFKVSFFATLLSSWKEHFIFKSCPSRFTSNKTIEDKRKQKQKMNNFSSEELIFLMSFFRIRPQFLCHLGSISPKFVSQAQDDGVHYLAKKFAVPFHQQFNIWCTQFSI